MHVCVDDASRLAFTRIHPDEKAVSAVADLRAAVAWDASMGVTVARVMTDNVLYGEDLSVMVSRSWGIRCPGCPDMVAQAVSAVKKRSLR